LKHLHSLTEPGVEHISNGAYGEVLEPESLRQEIAAEIGDMYRRYKESEPEA